MIIFPNDSTKQQKYTIFFYIVNEYFNYKKKYIRFNKVYMHVMWCIHLVLYYSIFWCDIKFSSSLIKFAMIYYNDCIISHIHARLLRTQQWKYLKWLGCSSSGIIEVWWRRWCDSVTTSTGDDVTGIGFVSSGCVN